MGGWRDQMGDSGDEGTKNFRFVTVAGVCGNFLNG